MSNTPSDEHQDILEAFAKLLHVKQEDLLEEWVEFAAAIADVCTGVPGDLRAVGRLALAAFKLP